MCHSLNTYAIGGCIYALTHSLTYLLTCVFSHAFLAYWSDVFMIHRLELVIHRMTCVASPVHQVFISVYSTADDVSGQNRHYGDGGAAGVSAYLLDCFST